MTTYKLLNRLPSVDEFIALRDSVGWTNPPRDAVAKGLSGTIYGICAEYEGAVVGMGRIVGDGGFTYFIADMVIMPELQRMGIGTSIMERLLAYIRQDAPQAAYITLMAAEGKESFYRRFGFVSRPMDGYGPGMMIPFSTVNRWVAGEKGPRS